MDDTVYVVESSTQSLMVDVASCGGDQMVEITLDELHRAYMFGYSNALDHNPISPAPVMVSRCIVVEDGGQGVR